MIVTIGVTERACSRCAEVEWLSNPDEALIMAVAE